MRTLSHNPALFLSRHRPVERVPDSHGKHRLRVFGASSVGKASFVRKLLFLILLIPAAAQGGAAEVPEALRDWQQWVLKDREYRSCPFYFDRKAERSDDFACAWPGSLDLSVDAAGGRFEQQWTLFSGEQWLPLPGDGRYWPEHVTVNGQPASVVMRGAAPSVRLGPGSYRVAGAFAWAERPATLAVPAMSGLLSLRVDGEPIARPGRTPQGVFLGKGLPGDTETNALRTEIYRLVGDGVPTRLTTVLMLDVAGRVREEEFAPLLPAGFVPLAIDSDLPARLESNGRLSLQVRPGEWRVQVTARAPDVVNAVGLPEPEANLPQSEVWSYRADVRLRVARAEGLPSVDPELADVPPGWRQYPAFRIRPGETLRIDERSRGIGEAGNELILERELWLDFDGSGFLAVDSIRGTMRRDWRLDMAPPYRLLSAREGGKDLQVTVGAGAGETGIELRHPRPGVESLAAADTRGALPVTGWQARFQEVAVSLNLPPGHRLLAAPGAERADTSWAGQWRLLDFFLISIVTVAAWRLLGRAAGAVALVALVLGYQEMDGQAWLWLNLLAAVALLRVAPTGRLRKSAFAYQAVSAGLLVLWLVPFVAGELRIALFPQLQPQTPAYGQEVTGAADGTYAKRMTSAAAQRGPEPVYEPGQPGVLEEFATVPEPGASHTRVQPDALVQTGPGMPDWHWNRHLLHWSGPVEAGQSMRLVIAPRWLVTTLRILEVAAFLAFAALLAAAVFNRRLRFPAGWRPGRAAAGSLLTAGLLGALLMHSPPAHGELPEQPLLDELERRLLEPPPCTPRCAEVVAARVDAGADTVRMQLDVHALAHVALPLPGSRDGWRPRSILIDGSAAQGVLRDAEGALWVPVTAGRHRLELNGPNPDLERLEIPFPAPPRTVEAQADGWTLAGLEGRRLASGSLHLTRQRATPAGEAASSAWGGSRFPAFVRIERELQLDLGWRATTTVHRVAPAAGALTLSVPLMDGESVTTGGLTADGGSVPVTMGPRQDSFSWESYLPNRPSMLIEAQPGNSSQEVWRVAVGGMWHARFSGVPESIDADGAGGPRVAEFHPRPGESLAIDVTRPEASPGETLAFDRVDLVVSPGRLSSTSMLTLHVRSTRGAQHRLLLPEGAEVLGVHIDGRPEPVRADGNELNLPVLPGEHVISLSWRTLGAIPLLAGTPRVDLGAQASNVNLTMHLPDDRWLLATLGPPLGPAVLYWAELAVLVLFALILGRIGLTPLRGRHWLLLGLGLSTYSWPVLGALAAWLLICGARERWRPELPQRLFNAMQVLIAVLTLLALGAVLATLPVGLLGTPDMHVVGNGSQGNVLNWFADRSEGVLPVGSAWTVPLWIYKALILAWALWFSFALLRWLSWVWRCFSAQGLWRKGGTVAEPAAAAQATTPLS